MERLIGNTPPTIEKPLQQSGSTDIAKPSRTSQPTQTSDVSREDMAMMLAVLAERWQQQGWRPMEEADARPIAMTFIRRLRREEIPRRHWMDLLYQANGLRASRLRSGLNCDDFSVDLLIACWPGLREELHEKAVKAGRTLEANNPTGCNRCYGTGREFVKNEQGRTIGVRPEPCTHEAIDPNEEAHPHGIDVAQDVLRHHLSPDNEAAQICERHAQECRRIFDVMDNDPEKSKEDAMKVWRAMNTWNSARRYCLEAK